MCWNFETSFYSAVFSTVVALFLVSRMRFPYLFYGISLLGITSMQWAEAYLWYYGDITNEQCSDYNKFGTQVLVPIAVMLQPLGPFFGAYISSDKKDKGGLLLRDTAKFFVGFALIFKLFHILLYVLSGGTRRLLWVDTLCTTLTEQGYLYWGAPKTLVPLSIWWVYVSFPVMTLMTSYYMFKKGMLICMYGLVALLTSYYFTDSTGSNWCLYIIGYSIIGLMDYIMNRKVKVE